MEQILKGTPVLVKDPGPNDSWNHAFSGHVKKVLNLKGGVVMYVIEDQAGEVFDAYREDFELDKRD